MRPLRGRATSARRLIAVAALLVAGCSSGGGGAQGPLNVQVASFDVAVGPPSRFIVGLLTAQDKLVGFGTVQMRFLYLGTKQGGTPSPPGPPLVGRYLPIPGTTVPSPPPAEPRVVSGAEARGVYGTTAGFDRAGFWQVEVTARIGSDTVRGTGAFAVNDHHFIPAPGDAALPTENLTVTSPSADVPKAAVDSRAGTSGDVPDPELHQSTIAAALAAHGPAVLVISMPVYCQSRFCGPVTDMVQQLSHTYGDRASFIHIEVWKDFEHTMMNKSSADWIFRNDEANEPWVFVIGADGRIVARFDNVATQQEIEPVLRQL